MRTFLSVWTCSSSSSVPGCSRSFFLVVAAFGSKRRRRVHRRAFPHEPRAIGLSARRDSHRLDGERRSRCPVSVQRYGIRSCRRRWRWSNNPTNTVSGSSFNDWVVSAGVQIALGPKPQPPAPPPAYVPPPPPPPAPPPPAPPPAKLLPKQIRVLGDALFDFDKATCGRRERNCWMSWYRPWLARTSIRFSRSVTRTRSAPTPTTKSCRNAGRTP